MMLGIVAGILTPMLTGSVSGYTEVRAPSEPRIALAAAIELTGFEPVTVPVLDASIHPIAKKIKNTEDQAASALEALTGAASSSSGASPETSGAAATVSTSSALDPHAFAIQAEQAPTEASSTPAAPPAEKEGRGAAATSSPEVLPLSVPPAKSDDKLESGTSSAAALPLLLESTSTEFVPLQSATSAPAAVAPRPAPPLPFDMFSSGSTSTVLYPTYGATTAQWRTLAVALASMGGLSLFFAIAALVARKPRHPDQLINDVYA